MEIPDNYTKSNINVNSFNVLVYNFVGMLKISKLVASGIKSKYMLQGQCQLKV